MHMQYACMALSNPATRSYLGKLRCFVVRFTAFTAENFNEESVLDMLEIALLPEKDEKDECVVLRTAFAKEIFEDEQETQDVQVPAEQICFSELERPCPQTTKRKPGRPRKKSEPQSENF